MLIFEHLHSLDQLLYKIISFSWLKVLIFFINKNFIQNISKINSFTSKYLTELTVDLHIIYPYFRTDYCSDENSINVLFLVS